jgi:hypothetical protein
MSWPDTKHVLADTRCNWLGIELDQPEQHAVKGVGSQLRQLDQNLAKVGGFAKGGDQFVLDSVAPNVKESGNYRALHINTRVGNCPWQRRSECKGVRQSESSSHQYPG